MEKKKQRERKTLCRAHLILASAVAQIPVRGVSFIDDRFEEELIVAKFDPNDDDIELLLLLGGGGGGGEKRKKALFAFSSSLRR